MTLKFFPAFINHEGQKQPCFKGWQDAATDDQATLAKWANEYGKYNGFMWGIPCGQATGIFALDVDMKPGRKSGFDSLKELGVQIPHTLAQRTPSGGYHFLFKTEPGKQYKNSVNVGLGLDTRGDGGWIAYYGFPEPNTPLAPIPDWVLRLSPVREAKTLENTPESNVRIDPAIAKATLERALQTVREAPGGESNDTLNAQAYVVGQLVASQALTRDEAFKQLFDAAKFRGKPDNEATATINSGLDGGALKPLTAPFQTAPVITLDIPAPPEPPARWTPKKATIDELKNYSALRKPQLFRDWSTRDIAITTADGGTGKTTLALFESVCLALGERFLGFDCLKPGGKTLFITGEDDEPKLKAMLGQIVKDMGLFEPITGSPEKIQTIIDCIIIKKDSDLCLISKSRDGMIHPNAEALSRVMQAVEDLGPFEKIVLDPISSMWGSEASLNDMSRAVSKWAGDLSRKAHAQVEMLNHMGKSSSATKDMTQFAGRGGSALPSHARVSRVLHTVDKNEFHEKTGEDLKSGESALICNVNKFSDGSKLLNEPFLILRRGHMFFRKEMTPMAKLEAQDEMTDKEKVHTFVKGERAKDRYPTRNVIIGHFDQGGKKTSKDRINRAIDLLIYEDHMLERLKKIPNPDQDVGGHVFTLIDEDGDEV